jgi:hypothetical protein
MRSRDEALSAVDVVRRARDGRVDHEVNGERGDVNRADHASDGQRRAQFLAPLVEIVTEERGDNGVSTKPGAMRLTRIGASSRRGRPWTQVWRR